MRGSRTFFKFYCFVYVFKFKKEWFCEKFRKILFIEKAFFNYIRENDDVRDSDASKTSIDHFDRNIIIVLGYELIR